MTAPGTRPVAAPLDPSSSSIEQGAPASAGSGPVPRDVAINVALVTVAVIIAACSPTAAKSAMREMPPFVTMILRYSCMALLMWMARPLIRRIEPQATRPIERADWLAFLIGAIIFVPVNQSLYLNGMRHGTAGHAGLLSGLNPLFTYGLTVLIGSAVFSKRMTLAILMGLAGAGLIGWESAQAHGAPNVSSESASAWLGDLLVLGSVATWAGYSVFTLPLARKYGAARVVTVVTTLGVLLASPLALIDAHALHPEQISASAWIGFAFIAIFAGFVNSLLWFIGAARMDINRFVLAMNINPVLAVFIAYLVHGEPLTKWLMGGGAAIIGAVVLANWDRIWMLVRPRPALLRD